jgi:hypothetical protein
MSLALPVSLLDVFDELAADMPLRMASRDDFVDAYFTYCAQDEKGSPLVHNPATRIHAMAMQWCFERGIHYSHVGPQGYGKTTVAQHFANWRIGQDQTERIVWTTNNTDISSNLVSFCKDAITSRTYTLVFPEVRPDNYLNTRVASDEEFRGRRGWTKDSFFVRSPGQIKDPTMSAVAFKGVADNIRVTMLVADDITTQRVAESDTLREDAVKTFYAKWLEGRLSNGGWACVLSNCHHKSDLAHVLAGLAPIPGQPSARESRFLSVWIGITADMERMFVRLYNAPGDFPLIANPAQFDAKAVPAENGACAQFEIPKPAGERWTKESLRKIVNFQRFYRLIALDDKDKAFPAWPQRKGGHKTVAQLLRVREEAGLPLFDELQRQRFVFAAGLDLSSTRRPGTVLWTVAKEPSTQIIYPVETHRGRDLDAASIIRLLRSQWQRGIILRKIRVESVGTQDLMEREIRLAAQREQVPFWGLVEGFMTGQNKLAEGGLLSLNTMIENGQIMWPDAEADRNEDWRIMESEMLTCPRLFKPGNTPDGPMAFWFAADEVQTLAPEINPDDFGSF